MTEYLMSTRIYARALASATVIACATSVSAQSSASNKSDLVIALRRRPLCRRRQIWPAVLPRGPARSIGETVLNLTLTKTALQIPKYVVGDHRSMIAIPRYNRNAGLGLYGWGSRFTKLIARPGSGLV